MALLPPVGWPYIANGSTPRLVEVITCLAASPSCNKYMYDCGVPLVWAPLSIIPPGPIDIDFAVLVGSNLFAKVSALIKTLPSPVPTWICVVEELRLMFPFDNDVELISQPPILPELAHNVPLNIPLPHITKLFVSQVKPPAPVHPAKKKQPPLFI